jgi:N-acetylmuramic acid 6-phosphate etherase
LGHNTDSLTVAAGVSGAGLLHRAPLAKALQLRLAARRVVVTDDLRPMMLANAGDSAAVLVIAGTGSSVLVQEEDGAQRLIGGRGKLFGEEGGGYGLAVEAIRLAAAGADGWGQDTSLVEELPKSVGVDSFREFTRWTRDASKGDLAALACVVCDAAVEGDTIAAACVANQAAYLARQAQAGLASIHESATPLLLIHGGLIEESDLYRTSFERLLAETYPALTPVIAPLRGAEAVARLAGTTALPEAWCSVCEAKEGDSPAPEQAPTEGVDVAKAHLDTLTAERIVDRMNEEDASIAAAVQSRSHAIARAVRAAADAIEGGGRLIYVGAGTSGRLGVLDAAECPPTFGVSPETVIGIIAGGDGALLYSVEGAEDDEALGAADLAALDPPVTVTDVVVGIAASGGTPYTRAALVEASERGAATVLLCCNPQCHDGADIIIDLDTGSEVLAGSTRLKAGTATKMVLNMISTGAMALSGHVYDGRMINVRPVNAKLHRRAVGIVEVITGTDKAEADRLLAEADGIIAVAVVMAVKGVDAAAAQAIIDCAGGSLRAALARE